MSSSSESSGQFEGIGSPYYFKPLYNNYRRALQFLGEQRSDLVHGLDLYEIVEDHDSLRQLVTWNFIAYAQDIGLNDYEVGIFAGDLDSVYRITRQTREYSALEMNNFADLERGILIWLRADKGPEVRAGNFWLSMRTIGLYELVMLLNKSENSIRNALDDLESRGFVQRSGEIRITDQGILYLEKGVTMTVNNVTISGSNVGVLALQSTLTNVEAAIGNLNSMGHSEVARRLTEVKEEASRSALSDDKKKELLEQVETIASEAGKPGQERKPSIIKSAISYIGTLATGAEAVKKLWETCDPFLKQYFGI